MSDFFLFSLFFPGMHLQFLISLPPYTLRCAHTLTSSTSHGFPHPAFNTGLRFKLRFTCSYTFFRIQYKFGTVRTRSTSVAVVLGPGGKQGCRITKLSEVECQFSLWQAVWSAKTMRLCSYRSHSWSSNLCLACRVKAEQHGFHFQRWQQSNAEDLV